MIIKRCAWCGRILGFRFHGWFFVQVSRTDYCRACARALEAEMKLKQQRNPLLEIYLDRQTRKEEKYANRNKTESR